MAMDMGDIVHMRDMAATIIMQVDMQVVTVHPIEHTVVAMVMVLVHVDQLLVAPPELDAIQVSKFKFKWIL